MIQTGTSTIHNLPKNIQNKDVKALYSCYETPSDEVSDTCYVLQGCESKIRQR